MVITVEPPCCPLWIRWRKEGSEVAVISGPHRAQFNASLIRTCSSTGVTRQRQQSRSGNKVRLKASSVQVHTECVTRCVPQAGCVVHCALCTPHETGAVPWTWCTTPCGRPDSHNAFSAPNTEWRKGSIQGGKLFHKQLPRRRERKQPWFPDILQPRLNSLCK